MTGGNSFDRFFSALLAIVVIDLVLAGDNAIVIALAARSLPPHLQKRAILWGTFGAIVVRTSMTLVVMGCVVNGRGEAREADLGVASGNGKGQIFGKGQGIKTVPESRIVDA